MFERNQRNVPKVERQFLVELLEERFNDAKRLAVPGDNQRARAGVHGNHRAIFIPQIARPLTGIEVGQHLLNG